jgi:hypothetical protein
MPIYRALPTVLCGSEKWSINRTDKRKIECSEMRILRPEAGHVLMGQMSKIFIMNLRFLI